MPKRATNIYKRKDGRWEARYVKYVTPDGKKRYGSVYGSSYSEAKLKQDQCIKQAVSGCSTAEGMSLTELCTVWLDSIKNQVKRSTYVKYESIIGKHFTSAFGQRKVKEFTSLMVSSFSDEKLSGPDRLSPKTVNDMLIVLGMILKFGAQEFGLPIPIIRKVKEYRQEMRVLSVDEQRLLEEYLYSNMDLYKLGVLLDLYTGLRLGELCALQWEDILGDRIRVEKTYHRIKGLDGTMLEYGPPKTSTSRRVVPLPQFLVPILASQRANGPFLKTRNGTPVEPRLLQRKFSSYIAACGLKGVTFHTLRHTYATRCIEADVDAKSLSELLGHSDVRTTLNRYVHSSFSQKQKSIQRLSPAYQGPDSGQESGQISI